MKSTHVAAAGLALAALAGVVGFGVDAKLKKAAKEKEKKAIERAFYTGTMPDIGNPWTKIGNVLQLKFKVITLGKVTECKLSERGNLLAWGAEHTEDPKSTYPSQNVYIFVDGQDQITKISRYERVDMFPNGELVKAKEKKLTDSLYVAQVDWHGESKRLDEYNAILGNGGCRLGAQYFLKDYGIYGEFAYFNSELKSTQVEIAKNNSYLVRASTSELGDVGTFYKLNSEDKALGFFKNGQLTREVVPLETNYWAIAAGGAHVAVTTGRQFFERIPYLRTGPVRYDRLAVPKNTVLAEVIAINSHKDYLLSCMGVCIHSPKHTGIPYDPHQYLVDRDVAYDIDELTDDCLHWRAKGLSHPYLLSAIDDNGDFVVTLNGEMFLFRRQSQ